jgi:hypothetical protein
MTPTRLPTLLRRAAVLVFVAGAVGIGHAASLGGIDADSLSAWSFDADIPPPPTTTPPTTIPPPPPTPCDDFSGSGDLNGRAYACGTGTWSTTSHNWSVGNGRVKTTTSFAKTATVPVGSVNATAAVTVYENEKNGRQGGVVVSHGDALDSPYLAAVLVGPNRVELRISNGPAIAGATVTITPATRLRLTRVGTQVWVEVNGVTVINGSSFAALSSLTGTRVGLFHGGGPPVEFDDFAAGPAVPPP